METKKCPKCQLGNRSADKVCKRCNSSLNKKVDKSSNFFSTEWTIKVITRNHEIIIGILCILAGLFLLTFNWMSAINVGIFRASITILAPVFIGFGFCCLIYPYPEKEHFPKLEYAPKHWAFLIVPSILFGIINCAYFYGII